LELSFVIGGCPGVSRSGIRRAERPLAVTADEQSHSSTVRVEEDGSYPQLPFVGPV